MKFKLPLVALLSAELLFSCSPPKNKSENGYGLFANFFKGIVPLQSNANVLNGVWTTEWINQNGYTVTEFVSINDGQEQSFFCVLNPMGGYEYSPAKTKGTSVYLTAVDPAKNIYINNLGTYGKYNHAVQLNYNTSSDTLEWTKSLSNTERSYSYTRLVPTQKKEWELFNSTCGQIITQSAKINTNELKIEKLNYVETYATIGVLQTSKQPSEHTNYCVFNTADQTVLSLPVNLLRNKDVKFSNLDLLRRSDRSRLFKSVSTQEMAKLVSPSMMAICSAITQNTRDDSEFPNYEPFDLKLQNEKNDFFDPDSVPVAGEKASTYLVCKYRNAQNGSNAGWEWAEYPRWEWQKQTSSCRGLFASNCVSLNGRWARDDVGFGAIGTLFMMDATSQLEADFHRACNETNVLVGRNDERDYAEYHVSDSALSFYHNIWFQKTTESPYPLPFNRIVAFGDSLTDNGNLHMATGSLFAAAGYYQGRLSNGLVWVEYLSKRLKLDLYDWAVAGAASDLGDITDIFKSTPYTLADEFVNFESAIDEIGMTKHEISKMLFTVLIGANNFGRDIRGTPEEVAYDHAQFIENIISLGAKHIMFINLPDVSMAPTFNRDYDTSYEMRVKILATNQLLEEQLKTHKMKHPEVTFYYINLFKTFDDVLLNASKYNITNITDQCYTGGHLGSYNPSEICSNPEEHLFWDELHPGTTFACQAADITLNALFDYYSIPRIPVDYDGCVRSYIH